MNQDELQDLRVGDNECLDQFDILQSWIGYWETELHKIEHPDRNQERWSLSKRSFLVGYLTGLSKDSQEQKKVGA